MKRFINILAAAGLLCWLALPALPTHAASDNLLANPSVETIANGQPANWTSDTWGSSTTSLTTTSDAHTGSEALTITTTARTSGDAKWIPDAVAVTSGQTYTYSDYSKATVATELDAAYTDASGNVTYAYLSAIQPSSAWQANTIDFKVPAGKVKVSIMHILATAGSLTTDDFSLTTQASPVVVPPPTSGNLIANPSMEVANGSAPAAWQSSSWGTNTTSFAYSTNDGHSGTASAKIETTSYTSGDAKWYFNPVSIQAGSQYTFSDYYKATIGTSLVAQFDDGNGNYSYQTLANPAAASAWTQASATFIAPATAKNVTIFHLIAGVGSLQTDDASLTATSQSAAPTVTITAPQDGTTVSGTITLSATSNQTSGISSIRFQLNGADLGSPITAAPYQYSWNTTATTDGTHDLTAILTPTNGSPVTSSVTHLTVHNATATGGNLIPNASVETVNATNSKLPVDWQHGTWGTNTASFSYLTSGHSGTRSVKAQISSYTSGAAYWYVKSQPITGGQMYDFKDYYKSNTISEIDAGITMADGSEQDMYLGDAFKSPNSWTKFETQFTAPAGAVSITFYHNIYSVGYVTTDDYSLTPFSYQGFNRAIVSITDDDGYASFYNNGLPLLQKYNLPSTAYIITNYVNNAAGYISLNQLHGLYNAGVEIGSHTLDHPDLSTVGATKQNNELKNSQTALQNWLGVPVVDFAAPYGAYNQQIVTDAQQYYQTYRSVQAGYNAKNNFDAMHLQVQNIVDTTTVTDIQNWLNQAAATHTWLILVYHQIDSSASAGEYNTYPSDFEAQLAAIKNSGISVETVREAMNEITPQLGK